MAYVNGIPSTDLSRADQEYVKAVAEEAASGGGGGASGMVVNFTAVYDDSTSTYTVTADKTNAEIIAAAAAGTPVTGVVGYGGDTTDIMQFCGTNEGLCVFSSPTAETLLQYFRIYWNDHEWSAVEIS